jgi:hypothetical protein
VAAVRSARRWRRLPGGRVALVSWLAACAWLGTGERAAAHLGALSYSDVVVRGGEIDYKLRFATHLIPGFGADATGKLTRRDVLAHEADITAWLRRSLRVALAGEACAADLAESVGPDQNDDLTVVMRYKCPAAGDALRIEFHAFDETLPDFQNIVTVKLAGRSTAFVFTPVSRVLVIGAAGTVSAQQADIGFRRFFTLGVERSWAAYDQLAFVLALLLPGATLAGVAGIVAAFAVAHSATLALAALGVLALPAAVVNAAIAASVTTAALYALRPHARDHRRLLAFAFGLAHGFGFAAMLGEAGLPAGAVAVPLLAFNLGVEAGLLAVVVLSMPLIRAAAGLRHGPAALRVVALTIAAFGAFRLASVL